MTLEANGQDVVGGQVKAESRVREAGRLVSLVSTRHGKAVAALGGATSPKTRRLKAEGPEEGLAGNCRRWKGSQEVKRYPDSAVEPRATSRHR